MREVSDSKAIVSLALGFAELEIYLPQQRVYPDSKGVLPNLRYAGADARVFEEAIRSKLGPLHDRIVGRLLVNKGSPDTAPTAANIRDALDILRAAKETDTVVVFLAGHGDNDGPNYRFLPTDAERLGDGWRSNKAVTWYAIEETLQATRGRRLLFVDTCHSGNAYNQRLGNASYHANIVAFSSARWDQQALERTDIGHGLFTYAVVEGISGKAGTGNSRQIKTSELHAFVVRRVDELARALDSAQEPQLYKGRDAEDFVLARW